MCCDSNRPLHIAIAFGMKFHWHWMCANGISFRKQWLCEGAYRSRNTFDRRFIKYISIICGPRWDMDACLWNSIPKAMAMGRGRSEMQPIFIENRQ